MKILHIISSADAASGGPIEAVRLLAAAHARSGHEVEIASLDAPEAGLRAALPVPLHTLGPGRGRYGYAPQMLTWLRANRARFDAAIVNGLWQYHGLAAWQALRRDGPPYYVFPHGMLDPWFKRQFPLKHLKKWLYWPWADYRVLRDAAGVLFTCEEERRLARQSFALYRAREIVTGLGTAGPQVDLAGAKLQFLANRPELLGKRIALFMGRLHPKKGCDLLIQGFAQVFSADPEWLLVMAGPDQVGWQAALRSLAARLGIADRIVWTGMLNGDAKWGALSVAEVFVLPSHQENFGIAVAEALACGTPVFISDKVNIWREISDAGAGLVAADTLGGTVELLERWKQASGAERSSFRQRALACYHDHFQVETTAARLIDVMTRP